MTSVSKKKSAITDANMNDFFLMASLGEHSTPGRGRLADGRKTFEDENTHIGSTTSE